MTIFCLIRAGWHALGDSEWTKGSSAASGHMLKKELFREEGILSGVCGWVGEGGWVWNMVEEIESVQQECTGRQMESTQDQSPVLFSDTQNASDVSHMPMIYLISTT